MQVQEGLLAEATAFRDSNIVDVTSYGELKEAISAGKWARGPWAGERPVVRCKQLTLIECCDHAILLDGSSL